jgi:hypothetical protein
MDEKAAWVSIRDMLNKTKSTLGKAYYTDELILVDSRLYVAGLQVKNCCEELLKLDEIDDEMIIKMLDVLNKIMFALASIDNKKLYLLEAKNLVINIIDEVGK